MAKRVVTSTGRRVRDVRGYRVGAVMPGEGNVFGHRLMWIEAEHTHRTGEDETFDRARKGRLQTLTTPSTLLR
jgi:hypothetical protein